MADGTTGLPVNSWTHLAATFDGATLRLFTNGVQTATQAYAGTLTTSANDLFIGGNSIWSEFFDGLIDEVRVYNYALTATQIQADMAAPVVPGSQPPPEEQQPTPDKVGSWTAPISFPLVAVHASMLSNGKVAMWDAFGAAMGSEKIWDPATGSFQPTPSSSEPLLRRPRAAAGRAPVLRGRHVLGVRGHHPDTVLLNPLTGNWAQGPQMARGRWYPTATTLPDGRGGCSRVRRRHPGHRRAVQRLLQAVGHDPRGLRPYKTDQLTAMPSAGRRMPLYPFMFVAPDGRVVDAGSDSTTRLLNVQTGQWSTLTSHSPIDGLAACRSLPPGQDPQVRHVGRSRLRLRRPRDQPRRRAGPQRDGPDLA